MLGPGGEQLTQFDGQGKWQRTNVYADGKLVGTYDLVDNPSYTTGGTALAKIPWLHFHFTDALGTRRMQVSGMIANLGQPETDFQSLPFGDQLATLTDPYADPSANDATPLHFTGKERDAESGNDYFGARYYGSSMGRMLSPDPSQLYFADQGNPQSLNLYAYVQNNPLRYIDRNGLKCFQVDSDGNLTGTSNAGDCATDANGNPTNNDIYVDDEKSKNPLLNDNGDLATYTNGNGQRVDTNGMPVIQIDATGMAPPGTDLNPSSWKLDFTLNLGVSLNYTLWGFSGTISGGLVTDSHRNVGTYFSYGGGTGQGAGFSGGIQGGVSNGRSICAMGGPFTNFSGTAGVDGAAGTVDYFEGAGDAPNGLVQGAGMTLGVGGGAGASATYTNTVATPFGSRTCSAEGRIQ